MATGGCIPLVAAGDPFLVVDDLVADGGGVAVSGVDDGLGRQDTEFVFDRAMALASWAASMTITSESSPTI
jgi:hypothetical protein